MSLFDNGYPEGFLLFIMNFNMICEASGTLLAGANIQYLCTIVCGEALLQFDTLSAEVGSTTSENLKSVLFGLGAYFFPVNLISK